MPDTPESPDNLPNLSRPKLLAGWVVILVLLTLVFSQWERNQENPNQIPQVNLTQDGTDEVVLKRNRYGHYVTSGFINGQQVTFLLDTGATYVAIPEAMAKRLHLKKQARSFASTANGVVEVFNTRIQQLHIGNIVIYDVLATINPGLNHDDQILLGMSALRQIEFTQKGDTLSLRNKP